MDQQLDYDGLIRVGYRRAVAASHEGPWACPFYKLDPVAHINCNRFWLTRISDVRQHIKRKHPKEAKEMRSRNNGSKPETNEGRWYALWDTLFPGRARPAVLYNTHLEITEFVIRTYLKQWKDRRLPTAGEEALTGCIAYLEAWSCNGGSEGVSSQCDADISEDPNRGTSVQDDTHHSTPLSTSISDPVTGSLVSPDLPPLSAGYCDTLAMGVTTEQYVPQSFGANSQRWALPANSATYTAMPTLQFPYQLADSAVPDGYVDYTVASPDPAGPMYQNGPGNFEYHGRDGPWGFS